ncbi:MAG TPA: non-homologous end-joining DNA ligase [Acidimicrobiales bacterium]
MTDTQVTVDGRVIRLRNLEKVLYPEAHFTKGEVVAYYAKVADVMLPHLAGRPLTMHRFPDGVEAGSFFEKNIPAHAPDWIDSVRLGRTTHAVLGERAGIVWAATMAALELHVPMGTAAAPDVPTSVVFDLDPGPGVDVVGCARLALDIRALLEHVGLECWAKTSGSKGMQVYLPLNSDVTYDDTTPFAHGVAKLLEKQQPDFVTSVMARNQRHGKVFVDWSQNTTHKTTVCVYSLRPRARPTVSTPLTWEEVAAAVGAGDAERLSFEAGDVLDRVEQLGDLFGPVLTTEQALPEFGA